MNNDFFDRTPAEKWELIKETFWRIFAPRAYANLYSQYQLCATALTKWKRRRAAMWLTPRMKSAACNARTVNCSSESTN